MDAQSLRSLLGMTVGTPEEIPIGGEETSLLQADNLDALFGDTMVRQAAAAPVPPVAEEGDWLQLLKRPAEEEGHGAAATAAGSSVWHFLLVRLSDSRRVEQVIGQLNLWFAEQGLAARAIDWKRASAGFGLLADILRLIFTGAILIVAVVAMVIIMNTLVVSVVERTTEIGTMRALGAHKSFVRAMLLVETLSITVVFGAAGIVLGVLILVVLNLLRIPATNMFLNALFGGPVLKARLAPLSVLSAVGVMALIGLLAHLYPVWIALRIQPVRAIQDE
jgi:ABC-type lipoprotein release transport system permease subunit